jgi:hypothetical protein
VVRRLGLDPRVKAAELMPGGATPTWRIAGTASPQIERREWRPPRRSAHRDLRSLALPPRCSAASPAHSGTACNSNTAIASQSGARAAQTAPPDGGPHTDTSRRSVFV